MRIVIARRDSLTHLDGVTTFTVNLAKGLMALNNKVALMSYGLLKPPEGYSNFPEYLSKVHGLNNVDILTIKGNISSHREPRVSLEWLLNGKGILRSWDADALIISGIVPVTFKPRVAVLHNVTKFGSRFERSIYKMLYASYDHTVCVSKSSRNEALEVGVICNLVIYNPVDLSPYKVKPRQERDNLIVHIGTRGEKNLHISIEAIKLLREEDYELKLAIIGSGAYEAVKGIVGNIPNWIEPLNNISDEIKIDILSRSLALLLPSSYETFSYVAVEAMASGTPPIVSEAVPDETVINNYNGLRVNRLSPEAFALAIKALLRDTELWNRLSANGIEYVKRFDYINVARQYEALLRRLLKTL